MWTYDHICFLFAYLGGYICCQWLSIYLWVYICIQFETCSTLTNPR